MSKYYIIDDFINNIENDPNIKEQDKEIMLKKSSKD